MSKVTVVSLFVGGLIISITQCLPTCPEKLGCEEWKTSTCVCHHYKNISAKGGIHIDKLTVGNDKNKLERDNLGEISIKGHIQFPENFLSSNDTIELQITFFDGEIIPCNLVFESIEKVLAGLTSALSDICALLENEQVQKLLEKLFDVKAGAVSKPYVCSGSFLALKSYSLDSHFGIPRETALIIEVLKEFSKSSLEFIAIELEVVKVRKEGSREAEPILCIVIPVTIES